MGTKPEKSNTEFKPEKSNTEEKWTIVTIKKKTLPEQTSFFEACYLYLGLEIACRCGGESGNPLTLLHLMAICISTDFYPGHSLSTH